MKRLLMALALSACSWLAVADSAIVAEHAWVREAPPSAHMLAAYMTIRNATDRDAVLVNVESPQFRHVMLHKSEVVDGMARMVHQDEIRVPAQGSVALEPGSYHLMMPAPETRLSAGDRVDFTLTFADGDKIRVQAEVRKKP
jgi:periplasmic copper chaperone A